MGARHGLPVGPPLAGPEGQPNQIASSWSPTRAPGSLAGSGRLSPAAEPSRSGRGPLEGHASGRGASIDGRSAPKCPSPTWHSPARRVASLALMVAPLGRSLRSATGIVPARGRATPDLMAPMGYARRPRDGAPVRHPACSPTHRPDGRRYRDLRPGRCGRPRPAILVRRSGTRERGYSGGAEGPCDNEATRQGCAVDSVQYRSRGMRSNCRREPATARRAPERASGAVTRR